MTRVIDPPMVRDTDDPALLRRCYWLKAAMEGVVGLMIAVAPWYFGSVEPIAILLLYIGLLIVAVLYSLSTLREGRLLWEACPLVVCLGLLLLLGVWQMAPLSRSILTTVSPRTVALY